MSPDSPESPTCLLAYARTRRGADDDSLVRALRRRGMRVTAFDDEKYVLPRWREGALRAVRRALRPMAVRELNRELVRTARALRPDLFFAFKGAWVTADTLRRLEADGVPSVLLFPDLAFEAFGPYLAEALPGYARIVTTKPEGARVLADRHGIPGARVAYVPPGYDPGIHRPVELGSRDRDRYGCDVAFVGHRSPWKERLLRALCEALPAVRVRIWGAGWEERGSAPFDRALQGVPVYGDEYSRAIRASAVALGLLDRTTDGRADVITARSFEIPAMRSFFLHEGTDEMARYFDPETEVPTFDGPGELAERVEQFLGAGPEIRDDYARRAYRRATTSGYSVDHRAEALIEIMRDATR